MFKKIILTLVLVGSILPLPAGAHTGPALLHQDEAARSVAGGVVLEASFDDVKGRLLNADRWTGLLSDYSGRTAKGAGYLTVFKTFGHPHLFRFDRSGDTLVVSLEDPTHPGEHARLEYAVERFDNTHVFVQVRFSYHTEDTKGAGLSAARAVGLMTAKAQTDLEDLRKAYPTFLADQTRNSQKEQ